MPDPRHKQNDQSKQAGPVFAWWPESSEHSEDREFLWNAALIEQMRGEHPEIWWPAGRGPWTIEETREELLRRQQQGQTLKRSMLVATTVAAVASGSVLSPGLHRAAAAPAPAAAPNEQTQATLASASSAFNEGALATAPEGASSYTVKKGDTMRGIAAQFGISTKALIAANSVGNPDLIHPGDKLNIPSGGDDSAVVEGGPEIEVKAGDTIAKLAERYGVSSNAIVRYAGNKISNPDLIIVGQKLTIPGGREAVVEAAPPAGGGQSEAASVESGPEIVVKAGDTIAKLAARYGVKQSAIVGHAANKINNSNLIVVGQKLTIPGGREPAEEPAPQETPIVAAVQQPAVQETVKAVAEPEKPAPAPEPAPVVQASGDFAWPTKGAITQKFGPSKLSLEPAYNGYAHFHQGLDIAAGMNTPIVAADGGSVVQSGWNGGYGYSVTIDHGNGLVTLYGHMASQPPVGVGQKVGQGQRIGSMGSTGASTGPHLHFAVKKNGTWVDPLKYLP